MSDVKAGALHSTGEMCAYALIGDGVVLGVGAAGGGGRGRQRQLDSDDGCRVVRDAKRGVGVCNVVVGREAEDELGMGGASLCTTGQEVVEGNESGREQVLG